MKTKAIKVVMAVALASVVVIVTGIPSHAAVVNPLAPAGVSIGMEQAEAEARLLEQGYKILGRCRYSRRDAKGSSLIVLRSGRRCDDDAPINEIRYKVEERARKDFPAPEALMEELRSSLDDDETECLGRGENRANCTWAYPEALPLVESLRLSYSVSEDGGRLSLTLKAAKNLEDKIKIAAGKMDPKTRSKPLEPYGIALGMAAFEAVELLREQGFKGSGGRELKRCEFQKDGVHITFATGTQYRDCLDAQPISHIEYSGIDLAGEPLEYLSYAEQVLGEPTRCSSRKKSYFRAIGYLRRRNRLPGSCAWAGNPICGRTYSR